jgi:hypothetical protein
MQTIDDEVDSPRRDLAATTTTLVGHVRSRETATATTVAWVEVVVDGCLHGG